MAEEKEDGLEEEYLAEEISEKQYKKNIREAIIEIAESIKENAEVIIEDPLEIESFGALTEVARMFLDLEDLMNAFSASRSEKKVQEKRKDQGKEAEEIIYWNDTKKMGWTLPDSDMAFYLRKVKKGEGSEENKEMYV